jgi:FkbM family methyltransferase
MDIKMRTSVSPHHRLQMSWGDIFIPADQAAMAELVAWQPDWKTEIITKLLAVRAGAFVDVGANCGQTLLDYFAAASTASYVGFEPNHHCVCVLNDIIRANARSDCLLIPAGLSDENGLRRLLLDKNSNTDSSASLDAELRPDRDCDVQFVACYKFDDIRPQIGIGDISLMKVDVEGAELSALRGMRAALRENGPWILCEVLHRDSKASETSHRVRMNDLMSFIAEMGYICLNIQKSADGCSVLGLVTMAQFPNKIWTWDNASECDYIFVPRRDVYLVSRLFTT